MITQSDFTALRDRLTSQGVQLVAVSKIQPLSAIQQLYDWGHRAFGENYVQEMVDKASQMPEDVKWHFIGHLQRNKVKYLAPFVALIHSVDSFKLLEEINKQAKKHGRVIDTLLQMHISSEDTKFGMDDKELYDFMEFYEANKSKLQNVRICGMMGMASFSDDETLVRKEFAQLKQYFLQAKKGWLLGDQFTICSMGMSGDFEWAIEEGSNLVRIGSNIFGARRVSN